MFLEYFNLNVTQRLELLVEICAKTIQVDANFHLVLRKVFILELKWSLIIHNNPSDKNTTPLIILHMLFEIILLSIFFQLQILLRKSHSASVNLFLPALMHNNAYLKKQFQAISPR